jgi:DNA-binding CsgD family transcriptional regulator
MLLAFGETLMRLFHLTPAEVRLALAFLSVGTIEGAATDEGLTRGTARQYIKRIFKKTGSRNQAQLMKLLLSID